VDETEHGAGDEGWSERGRKEVTHREKRTLYQRRAAAIDAKSKGREKAAWWDQEDEEERR